MDLRHKDGNSLNYHFDNLIYGTPKENADDKITHGTKVQGDKCHNSVLTERTVKIARGLFKCDFSITRIAEILNVKYSTVYSAIHGITWSHLCCELV